MKIRHKALAATICAVALGAPPFVATGNAANVRYPDCAAGAVGHFGYSPNMTDGTVSIVDLDRHKVIGTISGFGFPWNVAASPDGKRLYVDDSPPENSLHSAIDVVSVCKRKIIKRIPTLGLAFSNQSPDQKTVFSTNITSTGVQAINTATSKVTRSYLTVPLSQESVSADGKTLWVTALPADIYSIDLKTGLPDGPPIVPGILPAQFTISPDGSKLAVANLEGSVIIIDTKTRKITQRYNTGATSYPAYTVFGPNSQQLWIGTYSGRVFEAHLATGRLRTVLNARGWAAGITISADGNTAYIATTPSGSVVPPLGALYLAPVLLSAWHPGGVIRVINAHTYASIANIATGDVPLSLAIPHGEDSP